MPSVPYESAFLRHFVARVAGSASRGEATAVQTTYERTFRWHAGRADGPNLFLHRRYATLTGAAAHVPLAPFDSVLIDGQHGYECVRHDLAERGARVRPGGVILVHRARRHLDHVLAALSAWAAGAARWPQEESRELVKVFEDLRAAAFEGPRPPDLRDLREDFESEATGAATRAAG